MALVESALGLLAAAALAAVPTVSGLILGGEDLRLDLRAHKTRSGREILYARSHLVAAARAAGRWAFDTVCLDIATPNAAAGEARLARQLGFDGKLAIHPNQVASVNRAFSPSEREIQEAREIVVAYDEAFADGHGVLALNGRMVDAPVVAAARRLLARAV
jgi:citrate lyase subunit beta/citryl-CoA lyase